jgi:hypothetical protein
MVSKNISGKNLFGVFSAKTERTESFLLHGRDLCRVREWRE